MEAILLSGSRLSYESIGSLEMLRGQKIPIIGLNRREVAAFTSSIVVEREAGAAILGEYLGKQGHVICDYLEPTFSREVLENDQSSIHAAAQRLKEGMQQAGVEAQVDFFRTPEKYLQARQDIEHHGFSAKSASDICDLVINDYLDQRTGATAVVTPDIVIAWKLMAAMHHRGLRCPEDISIASFSVAGIGAMGAIPLTTVEYSVDYMSRKAMAAILGAIAGKKIAPVIKVPVELVGRDSCRAISKAVPARRSLVKNR